MIETEGGLTLLEDREIHPFIGEGEGRITFSFVVVYIRILGFKGKGNLSFRHRVGENGAFIVSGPNI